MNTRRLKKIEIAAAVIILLFAVGLRVNAPRADLPADLSFSGSTHTDEGNQCHNSRTKALYGEWFPDDWKITNYNPILPWIKLGIFELFGVGLVQVRAVNYLFAALSLLFFFLTLKSYFQENFKFALLGTLLLGTNYLYVMYNKIGTFETSIIFWVILSLYFLEKYRASRKSIFLFLVGASTSMAFIFKTLMAYAFIIPFGAYFLMLWFAPQEQKVTLKEGIRHILYILAGVLALFIPWYLFHYLPNKEWIISSPGQFMGNLIFPKSPGMAFRNFLTFPWKDQFYKIPIVWVGSLLYIPLFFRRLLRKEAQLTEMGYMFYFLAHTGVFFFMSYRPTRYLIPVIPAMVFMTVMVLERWVTLPAASTGPVADNNGSRKVTGGTGFPGGKIRKTAVFMVDILWLALAAYFCMIPLLARWIKTLRLPPLSIYYFIISALVVSAVYGIKNLYQKGAGSPNPRRHFVPSPGALIGAPGIPVILPERQEPKKRLLFLQTFSNHYQKMLRQPFNFKYILVPLVVIMPAISWFSDLSYYYKWYSSRPYNAWTMTQEMKNKLDNAYISGMTASVAVLESRHKTLWMYPRFVNWDEHTFDRYPITHALLGTDISEEIIHYFNQWPDRMSHAKLLRIYALKDYFLHFYSFVDPYIVDCRPGENNRNYLLEVQNPSKKVIESRVGEIDLYETDTEKMAAGKDYQVSKGEPVFVLQPGENRLEVPVREIPGPNGVKESAPLFFLEYPQPFDQIPLRYEGENFSRRTGFNRKAPGASQGFVRYYSREEDSPDFLAYGPAVPYARGFIVAKFKLTFENLETKIRPLCRLDIFSKEDQRPLVQRDIKPGDTKNNPTGTYELHILLPETKTLEFRVQAEKWSDISYDYLDIIYYQGYYPWG